MGKNKFTSLLVFLFPFALFAQSSTSKYIVYFKDKSTNNNISTLFTQKAIEKRNKQHTLFDDRDYPVNNNYVEQLQYNYATIINTSNWLNACLILIDEKNFSNLQQLPFVSNIVKVEKTNTNGIASINIENECTEANEILDFEDNYNSSFAQFHLLNGEYLHEQGFSGENMTIAICDNGFYNANNNPGFSTIFSENRLLGTYDYVHGDSLVFDESAGKHGSNCFSFIGGIKANQYIGTATKSNFYLFHTEDNGGERLQEEFNLATALERCSQLGVDVVSISLGYNTFDVASENHDTTDLRKNSTPAAKAVNMASSKGILVCVAAGNEGAKPWKYIMTPADADSAFAIASVDVNSVPSSFSSIGLPNDVRIKPNLAAVGQSAYYLNEIGNIAAGSGTSYATPSLAGMATCLWQAFPNKTNWEIKTAIEQSASQYLTPDKKIGYGIPDFKLAYQILSLPVDPVNSDNNFVVYPNPFINTINFSNKDMLDVLQIKILDYFGNIIYLQDTPTQNSIALNDIPKGIYILEMSTQKGRIVKKLMKV